jgi:hypothetical protein
MAHEKRSGVQIVKSRDFLKESSVAVRGPRDCLT